MCLVRPTWVLSKDIKRVAFLEKLRVSFLVKPSSWRWGSFPSFSSGEDVMFRVHVVHDVDGIIALYCQHALWPWWGAGFLQQDTKPPVDHIVFHPCQCLCCLVQWLHPTPSTSSLTKHHSFTVPTSNHAISLKGKAYPTFDRCLVRFELLVFCWWDWQYWLRTNFGAKHVTLAHCISSWGD